jgi:hypothetical protein
MPRSDTTGPNPENPAVNQTQLDSLVVSIELTLISIIQGVAFYFLVNSAYDAIVQLNYAVWPYIASGLIVILLFWSRSVIHTLTVIRWPLDFAHNFMYVACTLVEAVSFTQLNQPLHWFALNTFFGFMIWSLFVLDMGMINSRIRDSAGPEGNRLYAIVKREQILNIRFLVPSTIAFSAFCTFALLKWPDTFLSGRHRFLALGQFAASIGYLVYSMRFFQSLVPLITKTHQEWRDDVVV